ncbi:MAG: permease-like cell division protein FtsX [Patescibacteria group bacterium]
MLTALLRVGKFAVQSMVRNIWLTIATFSTVALTVLALSSLLAVNVAVNQIVASVEDRINVTLFLHPVTTESQANSFILAINALPDVSNVTFQTREQVLAEQLASGDPVVLKSLEALGENPFGPAVTVESKSPEGYLRIIQELQQPQFANLIEGEQKNFEENQAFLNGLNSFAKKIRLAGLVVVCFFVLISALMVFNAIRVAIYTQRQEIGVMRLVGASVAFIRGPLLLELVFYAIGAVVIANGVIIYIFKLAQGSFDSYFGPGIINVSSYFIENAPAIMGAEFLLISVLGSLSTYLAIRRHLNS